METLMLNHMTVTRAPMPLNQLVSIDPLVMRRSDYDRGATISTRTADTGSTSSHAELDAVALASPFCNPDL